MTTSKIQMDQIRSTSATVTGENIRAGSQKKSSLSQASGLHGASPDATCTCPSGDGYLVHPCPAHPAPVEQAGGDEREEFEAWMTWLMDHVYGRLPDFTLDDGSGAHYVNADVSYAWTAWQARAALAQPSPVSEALIYACKNLAQITSSDGSGHADIAMAVLRMAGVGDDERERLVNEWKAARAWKPSPGQAEKAEAERPEQPKRYTADVFYHNHFSTVQMEVVRASDFDEFATQYERIVGALRFERQQMDRAFTACINERDAALARVAGLEHSQSFQRDIDYSVLSEYADKHRLHFNNLCAVVRSALIALSAQAQHSVPEEFSFEYRHPNGECHTVTVSREQVINEMPDFLFEALCSKFCNCEPVGETNVVECCCDEYAEEFKLIAAAPGKEVGHE